MTVVSISMPETLRSTVDEYADAHGYGGRSEVVREALREFCVETAPTNATATDDRSTPRLATLVVCFEYGDASVERQIATLRRGADCVVAHTHGHAAGCCLELIVVYGTASQRRTLAANIRDISGVDRLEQSVARLPVEQLAASDQ